MVKLKGKRFCALKTHIQIQGNTYEVLTRDPKDLSIPLQFHGNQPNAFGTPKAKSNPVEEGEYVGDTRRGGSCNFEKIEFIPHCNGTHTEGVGHITDERISIHRILRECWIPATLISIEPESAKATNDICAVNKEDTDYVITKRSIQTKIQESLKGFLKGLVLRTLPNNSEKKWRVYKDEIPPYLSTNAAQYILELGVEHLLLDLPSADRMYDQGKLDAHHVFWEIKAESHDVEGKQHSMRTITELIYVPNEVSDGKYMLNLQIPSFVMDAAPSRPLLFGIKRI